MAVVVGVLAVGCAREEAPPGSLPDTRPPQVASTRPDDGAVVPDFDESLRIQFDEPVNVSPGYLRQVSVSPAWRLVTDFGFSDIRLRPEGGWRDGVIYTFRFPADLADILGNRREEGFDLRFSTGPPIVPTRASGRLLDRVDGTGIRDGRVIFLSEAADSIPYSVVSDTGGVFELEALPPGRYTAWGFEDLNANLRLDRDLEPYDSVAFELPDSTSSARITLRAVEPDSTPPVLAVAEALDSVTVRLEFDDPLEPEQDTTTARVVVSDTATGRSWPVVAWSVGELSADEDTAAADTVTADTAVADTAATDTAATGDSVPTDTTAAEPAAEPDTVSADAAADTTSESSARSDSIPLPSRELILRLGRPLEDGATYRVRFEGFTNLRKLAGAGDTTFVYEAVGDTATPPSVAPDAAETDTAAPRDSVTPPDTTPPRADGRPARTRRFGW